MPTLRWTYDNNKLPIAQIVSISETMNGCMFRITPTIEMERYRLLSILEKLGLNYWTDPEGSIDIYITH